MCITNNVTACNHPSLTISGELKDGMHETLPKNSADVSVAGDDDMDELATLMQGMAVKSLCATCQQLYVSLFPFLIHDHLTCIQPQTWGRNALPYMPRGVCFSYTEGHVRRWRNLPLSEDSQDS